MAAAQPENVVHARRPHGKKKSHHRRRSALFKRRFTRPGAPPGRFAGPDLPNSARIRVLRLEEGGWQEREDVPVSQLPPIQEQHLTWVDVRGVQDHDAVEAVGRHLGLHRMALADVVNVGQRPKVEEYEGVLFIVLRMAVRDAAGQAGGGATMTWCRQLERRPAWRGGDGSRSPSSSATGSSPASRRWTGIAWGTSAGDCR